MILPRFVLAQKLLFFFVLVASLPLIVVSLLWFSSFRNEIIKVTSAEVKSIASQVAGAAESFFTTKLVSLIIHSQTEAVLGSDLPKATTELKDFLFQDQDIKELTLLNQAGFEIVRVSRTKVYAPTELVDRSVLTAFKVTTFVGGERYVSPVYKDANGDLVVDIAIAIVLPETSQNLQSLTTSISGRLRKPGEIRGVLIETATLGGLAKSLAEVKIGQSGYVFVVDDKGIVLNHPKENLLDKNLKGVAEVGNFLRALTSGTTDTPAVNQAKSELGESVLTTHARIRPTNWGIIAEVPLAETLTPINQIGLFALLLLLTVLLFVILLSLQFSAQIVAPIKQLQSGASFIGKGNLAYRLRLKTGDEIEELAYSFNAMAESLEEAFVKLELGRETISAERNKLALVISGITDAVIAVDLSRRVLVFNSAAERITGFTVGNVLGKPIGELIKIFDKERELPVAEFCPIRKERFEGILFSGKELRLVGKGGKEAFVNFTAGQIKKGEAIGFGYIITLHDVTQEKKLEEMKIDFVSMAAHELRTPLTVIKGYLSVFRKETQNLLSEEQKKFLERIDRSADRLVALVEDLLGVTRIERGALSIKPKPTDWPSVVEPVVKEFIGRAKEKKIELTLVEPEKLLPLVLVDKLRIGEVLTNLLDNAVTYTNLGGKVKVSFALKGEEVITKVEDTGVGIPPEAIPHLFTKFYRAVGALEGAKGTGLGLYIAKSMVERHGGRIWVESQVGKGSTFSFSLLIAKPEKRI